MKDVCTIKKFLPEYRVIDELKKTPAPIDFQVLFYSPGITVDSLIEVIKRFESILDNKKKYIYQKHNIAVVY